MQKEINTKVIIDTIREMGKIFLKDYKRNLIPQSQAELFEQLTDIETTCFNVLKLRLNKYYPEIPWVDDNEFDTDNQRKPAPYEQYWLCDTMDGAVQYVNHLSGWTINLVLIRNGEPYFSVIYDPFCDELFYAKKADGAFMNGKRIQASTRSDKSVMVTVFEYGHQDKTDTDLNKVIGESVSGLINTFGIVRNYGPHGLQLAYVACGRIDLFVQQDLDTHNWLAGILIASEAGADLLSTSGTPWRWGIPNLLAGTHHATAIYLEDANLKKSLI